MTEAKQDPLYQDLMIHSPKASLPLHNYYKEFRLGQGDPLMKAAMEKWPCTTTSGDEDKGLQHGERPCTTLCDPMSGHEMWSSNDVVHIEHGKVVLQEKQEAAERRGSF